MNNDTEAVLKLYQDPNVLRKVQGLNAQAKGEVQILISGRGRAIQAKGEVIMGGGAIEILRSEERRVGKECRSRWSPYH